MSKYTTEVRFICENYAGKSDSVGLNDTESVIQSALPKIFDFQFPIYDENYRNVLETKIIKHFYTREIGFETVGSWKFWLNKRLNEIMPYYNQLYKSTLIEFNPFYDVDYKIEGNRNGRHDETSTSHNTRTDKLNENINGSDNRLRTDNLSESTSDTENNTGKATTSDSNTRTDNLHGKSTRKDTNNHEDAYSDTPQGALDNVKENKYLTNARAIKENNVSDYSGDNTGTQKNERNSTTGTNNTRTNNGSRNNTGTQDIDESHSQSKSNTGTQDNDGNGTRNYSNTDDYLEHVTGKRNGTSYSQLLKEYRKNFLNIDMMVIEELNDLFMNLW